MWERVTGWGIAVRARTAAMQWLSSIAWICLSWIAVSFGDCFLRAKSKKYEQFLESTGLFISMFQVCFALVSNLLFLFVECFVVVVYDLQIKWHGSRLTNLLERVARLRSPFTRRILGLWFMMGSIASIFCLIGMFSFLTYTLFMSLGLGSVTQAGDRVTLSNGATAEQVLAEVNEPVVALVAVIPGLNVPLSEVPIFVVSLAVAAIVHELGHALAALNEEVTVNGFGLYFLIAFPAALTELDTDGLGREIRMLSLLYFMLNLCSHLGFWSQPVWILCLYKIHSMVLAHFLSLLL